LSYEQQIHSTGDRFSDESIEKMIKSPLKRKSVAPSASLYDNGYGYGYGDVSSQKKKASLTGRRPIYRPPPHPPPPTPPEVVLTSKGKLKTTYTPSLDLISVGTKPYITEKGNEIIRYVMLPFEYKPEVTLPLSYIPVRGNIYEMLSEEERTILDTISRFHEEYSYLSPYIYNVLESLLLTDHFGIILVFGKLRDELIENIKISNIKTIQSRTQLTEENANAFLRGITRFSNIIFADTGPSPSMPDKKYPYELKYFKFPIPKHEPSPTSLQVVGYNTHPMYNQNLTPNDIQDLVQKSEVNKRVKGKETLFILAHGMMGYELSPELKILANKYLRVIEMGKKHNILSPKYASFYLRLSNTLLNPDNAVMFENTDVGEKKRKEIFEELSTYFNINAQDARVLKDTFSLVELTHDRIFSGHFTDTDIQEDHDVNMNTLYRFYSMGIFKPVDYRKKINKFPLHKKKIFELYPGTTFSTKSTTFELVKTLLPIAIRENKVMNIFISSCAVEYKNTDPYFEDLDPLYKKPSNITPAMKLLVEGKKFIFSCNRITTLFILDFYMEPVSNFNIEQVGERSVYTKNFEYFPVGQEPSFDNINTLETKLRGFYLNHYIYFLQEVVGFYYSVVFSFAGIDEETMSYNLIQEGSPLATMPHVNEIIKVKIYLMEELYRMFSKTLDFCLAMSGAILEVFTKYYNMYSNDASMVEKITPSLDMINTINDFFTRLNQTMSYINTGFYGSSNTSSVSHHYFLRYPKYIEVKKEYDESNVKELYDEINQGMDYTRFRRDIPDVHGLTSKQYFPEPLKGIVANPLPPDAFHHIARNTYKYKEIPNVDKVRLRRRTMKSKRGSLAVNPSAKDSYHISV
jgi:hypothetical protein